MAKAQILSNVFGQHSAVGSTDRYNQFVASVDGIFFICNPVWSSASTPVFQGFRVVDKEAATAYEAQGIYSGGTKEQRLAIIAKLGTYTQLGTYRNSSDNTLKTEYMPEETNLNAGLKQSTPYADPFTLLAPARTANEVRVLLGLPQVDSSGNQLSGGGNGGGTNNPDPNAKKSIFNTIDILTGDNTKYPTTGYDLASVQEAFDKDPIGTTIVGVVGVEGLTFAATSLFTDKPRTMIVGKLWGGDTILGAKKSKPKRRKSGGKDKKKDKKKKK